MHKNKYRLLIATCIVGLAISTNTSFANDTTSERLTTISNAKIKSETCFGHFVFDKNIENKYSNTPTRHLAIINGGSDVEDTRLERIGSIKVSECDNGLRNDWLIKVITSVTPIIKPHAIGNFAC